MKKMTPYTSRMKNFINVLILITFFGNWSKSDESKKKEKKEEHRVEISIGNWLDMFYNQVKMIIKG